MLRLDRNHSRVIYRARHPFKKELKRRVFIAADEDAI